MSARFEHTLVMVSAAWYVRPMRLLLFVLLAVLLVGGSPGSRGSAGLPEDYLLDIWDTDSGLPHSTVTSIAQTPDGYLWVGTLHGGLARFDGVRFVPFHPGNTPQLSSMEVQRMLVDPEGTLWICFVGGQYFSYRNGIFKYEHGDPRTPRSWFNEVVSCTPDRYLLSTFAGWLMEADRRPGTNVWRTTTPPGTFQLSSHSEDRQGAIWYRTADGRLVRYQQGQFEVVTNLAGLQSRQITAMVRDAEGQIWVGTETEVAVWTEAGFVNMTPGGSGETVSVQQLCLSADGGLWVRTRESFKKCFDQRWLAEASVPDGMAQPSTRPLTMRGDARGGLWVIHYGEGLWHVAGNGRTVRIGQKQGLPSGAVECWFEDREGNIWVGFSGGGLARLRKRTFHLVWPDGDQGNRGGRSVSQDAFGDMWFGTSDRAILRWRNDAFQVFEPPPSSTPGRDSVVCPGEDGRLWIGTVQEGVWCLQDGQFTRPFGPEEVGTVARALFLDSQRRLWIGNEFGLYCWQTNSLRQISTNEGFAPGYVLSIAEGAPGEMWVGIADAELRHFRNGRWERHRLEPASRDIRFWALLPETNGVVWIGTLGAGLLRYEQGRFFRYTRESGLPNEHVSQILADPRGQLWLGTRAGICRVEKSALEQHARGEIANVQFITYGKSDGLPSVECAAGRQPGCWRDREDRLWFATTKGVVWARAADLPFNPLPPPVHIEELWVDGRKFAPPFRNPIGREGKTTSLRVPPGRHYLEFHFTALSFAAPDKVLFRWKMEGLEKDWVEGQDRRAVSYSFIPPGDYRFRVQACNNDHVWNEEGDVLAFTVLPFFWQTWWSRWLVAVAVVAALGVIYSIRISRLRGLERLRLRIARDLHDEVGANLGSIALLAQVMQKEPCRADAGLIRSVAASTIDTLRDIVWFIEPRHDQVSDLVARMEESAHAMLQGVAYRFIKDVRPRTTPLPLQFRRNALPIFKEILHNIMKHSRAQRVEISLRVQGGLFELVIKDNGVGFRAEDKSSGCGLRNMRRRAAEVNGSLNISTSPGNGCTVAFSAPIPGVLDW